MYGKERAFFESKEKPRFLYHGTVIPNIENFEPKKRYTPGGVDAPPRIYATPNPAFAAAHAFPWGSDEGFDLQVLSNGKIRFTVPEQFKDRLMVNVYIYSLDSKTFDKTEEEHTGETYHSEQVIKREENVLEFESVIQAIEHFGGKVEFKTQD